MTAPAECPWGLTHLEERALIAMSKTGCVKRAARVLGCAPSTVGWHLKHVHKKMAERSTLVACVRYQRFRLTGEVS